MAQINLLKQNTSRRNVLGFLPALLVKLLAVCLAGAVVYYIWLFLQVNKVKKQIVDTDSKIKAAQTEVKSVKERDELITRQAQLAHLDELIDSHVYFSQLFPKLAQVTLKTASYSSLRAATDGEVTLSVTVPNLAELDKYLQVFDDPEINKHFSDLKIGSLHKIENGDEVNVKFDLRMNYDPGIIKYKIPANIKN